MNIFHIPPTDFELKFPFEGMNEVGLTISALYFEQSVYEQSQPGKPDLYSLAVLPAILANCSSVEDAIQLLESVSVVAPILPNVPAETAVFHWAITDASGRSVVVEYLQGKRNIVENHPRDLAESEHRERAPRRAPDRSHATSREQRRVDLSPNYPLHNDFMQVKVDDDLGVVPRPIGHGWNLFGLPGDTTSPSRFIRLFYLRAYAMKANPVKNFDDAVVLGTALLNNVFIPFGPVAADPRAMGDGPEFTDYGVLKRASDADSRPVSRGKELSKLRLGVVARFSADVISDRPLDLAALPATPSLLGMVSVVSGEIIEEIQKPSNEGAFFVLPSQLNGAEYPMHNYVVEQINKYKLDKTGGPRGQLAVHPAVGQFILDNAASDKRSGLDAAQKVLLDAKAATSWPTGYSLYVKNGYMGVPSCPKANQDHVLRCLEASLHHMRCICAKDVPSCGLRPDLQGPSTTKHKVSMVYASAIPVKAYLNAGNLDVPFQEEVGRLVIVSQYFGALRLAYEAAKPGTKQKIFLMPLGGGVFNNRAEVILGALGTALDLLAQHLKVDPAARLDVQLLAFRGSVGEQDRLTKIIQLLVPATAPVAPAAAAAATTPAAPTDFTATASSTAAAASAVPYRAVSDSLNEALVTQRTRGPMPLALDMALNVRPKTMRDDSCLTVHYLTGPAYCYWPLKPLRPDATLNFLSPTAIAQVTPGILSLLLWKFGLAAPSLRQVFEHWSCEEQAGCNKMVGHALEPGEAFEAEQQLLAKEIMGIFDGGNATCRSSLSCCTGSAATVSQELWSHVKAFAPNYHVRELLDSTPRMLERHYTFYNLWDRMKRAGSMQVFAADCYFGVVAMLLNALPAIEFEDGLSTAQEIFLTAVEMLERNNDTEGANWTIPREPLELQMPFFLGLLPNNCAGSKLRIYVYDTQSFSVGSIFCSAGQWGVEVLLHRYFASSTCRTTNPEEADLFLVPDYRACHLHLAPTYMHKGLTRIEGDDYHSQIIRNHKDKYRHPDQAEAQFQELLKSLKYFDRKQGMDHIFIFSDQGFIVNFTHTFPSWRDHIAHSIFLTTEAFTPGCGPSCFSPWKDAVIPGHIDMERFERIASFNQPTSNRSFLFNFHGRLPVNHDYYEKVSVRKALLQFERLADVSVGGFIEEYFEVMGSLERKSLGEDPQNGSAGSHM
ncbi:Conjugated bile acid hydrolase (CBAH) (Bile salt hydrolase) (BSH) (CBAH-1) (Choloylglycine hydrolase) [Durusdinium trenchii]|uniref:Conjugated bile acid hydrolase (CBAH) (Bile salt hydrolase) (BSH) (CBAH-1) (Choloylglycine hydrolase) n=1 Tax=Durusdinium trenchii TaxID=1381693 RepID=A0ABP0PQJ6_9DINO